MNQTIGIAGQCDRNSLRTSWIWSPQVERGPCIERNIQLAMSGQVRIFASSASRHYSWLFECFFMFCLVSSSLVRSVIVPAKSQLKLGFCKEGYGERSGALWWRIRSETRVHVELTSHALRDIYYPKHQYRGV
jgi:hypothetical protein